MPRLIDFDQYDLTAADLAALTASRDGAKLVHNLTDRGIIPFRKNGRARLYSFASLLTLDAMIRARGVGLNLNEGAKLAEIVVDRAKARVSDQYIALDDIRGWQFLIYAIDRECEPPMLQSYIVDGTEKIADLQLTLVSGWFADVTSLFPIDRAIWECANNYDRMKTKQESSK